MLLFVSSGCSGSESAAQEAAPTPSAVVDASAEPAEQTAPPVLGRSPRKKAPGFVGVQHAIPMGAALTNVPRLYEQVTLTGCGATADGWQATGTAANESSTEQTLRVLVLFTDAQARTVDSASTTVTVPVDSSETWTAEQKFSAPEGTRCLVRSVMGKK